MSKNLERINTLKRALYEALSACELWEIRLDSNSLPVTLESPASLHRIGLSPQRGLVLISSEEVGRHYDQFFGLNVVPKVSEVTPPTSIVVDESETILSIRIGVFEDVDDRANDDRANDDQAGDDRADGDDLTDEDDYIESDDDEEDDGQLFHVEPTSEQYAAWEQNIFDTKLQKQIDNLTRAKLLV